MCGRIVSIRLGSGRISCKRGRSGWEVGLVGGKRMGGCKEDRAKDGKHKYMWTWRTRRRWEVGVAFGGGCLLGGGGGGTGEERRGRRGNVAARRCAGQRGPPPLHLIHLSLLHRTLAGARPGHGQQGLFLSSSPCTQSFAPPTPPHTHTGIRPPTHPSPTPQPKASPKPKQNMQAATAAARRRIPHTTSRRHLFGLGSSASQKTHKIREAKAASRPPVPPRPPMQPGKVTPRRTLPPTHPVPKPNYADTGISVIRLVGG